MKILVLQIRDNPSVQQEEMESFIKYSGLKEEQFTSFNVFDTPVFGEEILKGYDALIVGGASEASVLKPKVYPFVDSIIALMKKCVELDFPVFASCFGFQAAVLALDGVITRQEKNFEMGTYPMSLTAKAITDPIFKNISPGFYAVSVHQEKATSLPEVCELLAFTDYCTHAFKVSNKRFWAFQFHPELDLPTLKQRLGVYQEKYTEDAGHFQKIINSLKETNEANLLIKNFINFLSEA
jgi:GMP synthase (glutamine-hydrolysing)